MIFDEVFSKLNYLESIYIEGSELIKSSDHHSCFVCGKQTHWLDINFQAALCSLECEREAWSDYLDAVMDYGSDIYGV